MKRVLARQEDCPHVLDGRQLILSIFHELFQDFNSDAAGRPSSFPVHDKLDRKQVTQQSTQKENQRQIHLAVDPDIMNVKILDGEDAKQFVISGRQEGLALAGRSLNTLVHSTTTKKMELKQPGLRTFFSSGKAGDLVEKVEKDQKCVVRVEKIFPEIEKERLTAVFAESDSTDSEVDEIVYVEDKSGILSSNNASSFSLTTQGHTISWKTGNIAQERVSVDRCD